MDTQKHKEHHFHVILTSGSKACLSIASGKILEGKLSKWQRDLIKAWMLIHKEEFPNFSVVDCTIK